MLDSVLNDTYPIYAHSGKGKPRETLEEHTSLCLKYYSKLMKSKKLEGCITRLGICASGGVRDIILNSIEDMVRFHDTGKLNPVFQEEVMGNRYKRVRPFHCLHGRDHALLSAFIYFDSQYAYIDGSKDMTLQEKDGARILALANAYIISRHHSDLGSMDEFEEKFLDGGEMYWMASYFSDQKQPLYKGPFFFNTENITDVSGTFALWKSGGRQEHIARYYYIRLMYSLLVSCDYYATTEYENGNETKDFGDLNQKDALCRTYEQSELVSSIRKYEKGQYGKRDLFGCRDINVLRSEIFLDVEKEWERNRDELLFFLESPTGSGKSNTSMNISFRMLDEGADKIFYIYPFNTLIEQNMDIIKQIFGNSKDVLSKITVVNSLTPIRTDEEAAGREHSVKETETFYQKALLDRQFLNYPFILSTHVSLFNTIFGSKREDVFGFLQLAHSVVILDEIQSYRNEIWTEIICFLRALAEFMDCRIIIMSATLPDLEYLTGEKGQAVRLLKNREEYFSNPLFRNRVELSYKLMGGKMDYESLYKHIKQHTGRDKKVLVEFIRKKSAYKFHEFMFNRTDLPVFLLTGDDNIVDRKRLLENVKTLETSCILIATQVVEAGVDIDMDIGYKDISKLDSEEQFMGRINRSCRRLGIVYFFNMDSADFIYKNDARMNRALTLISPAMQEILQNKKFEDYYKPVFDVLKKNLNESSGHNGLEQFFGSVVGRDFGEVAKRMRLIEDDMWHMTVYLSRQIKDVDGKELDGDEVWDDYKRLLANQDMDYAEKQVKLSEVKSRVYNFIYEIKKNSDLPYSDSIGEIYKIDDGEKYFTNGKMDREKLENGGTVLI